LGAKRNSGTPGNDIGTAGPFRLWSEDLFGQIGWLLAFALLGIPATLKKGAFQRGSVQRGAYVFWAAFLLTTVGFFSFGGYYHRYYLCMVAPALAVLTGIGFAAMLQEFVQKDGWRQWLLPTAVLLSIGLAILRLQAYENVRVYLIPIMLLFAAIAFALLSLSSKRRTVLAALCLLIALQAGPFCWSLTATFYPPINSTMPFAGPELYENIKTPGMTAHQEPYTGPEGDLVQIEKYLVEHYRTGSYLVVAQRANDVAGLIIDTGLPAVAYGGFLGWDGAISLDKLKALVDEGVVTYFLVPSGIGRSMSALTNYVTRNAKLVDPSEYGGFSSFGRLYLFE
jgi:4-amino-4-deoxy-L-arabinose transferase-like glycosyltransferase